MLLKKILARIGGIILFSTATFSFAENINWQPLNNGMTGLTVSALGIDGVHNNEVWLATSYGGLYKSNDSGQNWTELNHNNFAGMQINFIQFNPQNVDEMYVGTEVNGIYKSLDHGQTWQQINNGISNDLNALNITAFAFNPINTKEIYVGTTISGGFFKSIDGGQHWLTSNKGLSLKHYINSIAVNPSNPNIIFIGIYNNDDDSVPTNIFKSVDDGATWQPCKINLSTDFVYQIDYVHDHSNQLYAAAYNGFFKSEDGGNSWIDITPTPIKENRGNKAVLSFAVNPKNSREVFINTVMSGVFKTKDGGQSWQAINHSYDEFGWNIIAMNPVNTSEFYLTGTVSAKKQHLYISKNSGTDWQLLTTKLPNLILHTITVDPFNANNLYAGGEGGLWITHDGKNWSNDTPFAKEKVMAVEIDPTNPKNIFVGLNLFDSAMDEEQQRALFYSHDGGQTWQPSNLSIDELFVAYRIMINPDHPQQMFLCGDNFIYQSSDGGINWSKISERRAGVCLVKFNPRNSQEIYNVNANQLNKSIDGGKTWALLPYQFPHDIVSFAVDPVNPKKMYVSLYIEWLDTSPNFYRSDDGGLTWSVKNQGLPQNHSIANLLIDKNNPQTIYVTGVKEEPFVDWIVGDGVFVSYDSGDHWQSMNTGLDNLIITDLVMNQNKLIASTFGSGLFIGDIAK